jgi:phospholipid/cholesterol/gamma-HCH transport system substrate-binding protein
MMARIPAVLASAVAGVVALAGCGVGGFAGLYNTPLPGGAELGEHPYRITVQFAEVLDLVPQASVKVNDVAVGRVEKIELAEDNSMVLVSVAVNGSVRLPANANADLRQSSLLGEKFVQLRAPAEAPQGALGEGSVVPMNRTNRTPEIEEVLGALSLLLNGGGIGSLQNIVRELNKALSGNEAEIRSFLTSVDTLVTDLDGQRDNIVRAIDGLNRMSSRLTTQTANITEALNDLAPGLQVIEEQRDQLVTMLRSLDTLSTVAVDTLDKSRDDIVADLKALVPPLRKLVETGKMLPVALEYIVTYPYPSYAVNAIRGDYFNVDARLDLDFATILENLNSSSQSLIAPPGQPYGSAQNIGPIPLPLPLLPAAGQGSGGLLGFLLGGK